MTDVWKPMLVGWLVLLGGAGLCALSAQFPLVGWIVLVTVGLGAGSFLAMLLGSILLDAFGKHGPWN